MPTVTTKPADTQLMSGADILVKSLVDHGVDVLFAYPGGASMPCTSPSPNTPASCGPFCHGMNKAARSRLKVTRAPPESRAW